MGKPIVLQERFSRMVRDAARYALPAGACWNLVDYLPDLQANARKRGGWSYASNDISAVALSAAYVTAVAYAPFSGGAKLCAMTDNNKFVTIATNGTVTQVSTSGIQSLQNPVFHSDKLIITGSDGATAPKYYDGTTFGALAGTPPNGKYATVWKDRTVLASTSTNLTKTYFSAAADPTSWDTTNRWISTLRPPTGLAPLPGALMIFQDAVTARVRGSIPPSSNGLLGDFIMDDPVFNTGCTDARSIASDGAIACFANPTGVYLTNGTNIPVDVTKQAGLKKYWQDQLSGYSSSSWTLAGGIFRKTYFISVMNGSTFVDAFWFDLEDYSGGRLSNLKAVTMAAAVQVLEELYIASRAAPRVNSISSIYSPAAGVKNDADGTAVAPVLETPFFLDTKSGRKTWRSLIVEYDMRDAATDNPILTVSYIKNPDDSYTALSTTLAETTTDTRDQLYLRFPAQGLGLKFAQTNASSDTRIVAISADVHSREPSRTSS